MFYIARVFIKAGRVRGLVRPSAQFCLVLQYRCTSLYRTPIYEKFYVSAKFLVFYDPMYWITCRNPIHQPVFGNGPFPLSEVHLYLKAISFLPARFRHQWWMTLLCYALCVITSLLMFFTRMYSTVARVRLCSILGWLDAWHSRRNCCVFLSLTCLTVCPLVHCRMPCQQCTNG